MVDFTWSRSLEASKPTVSGIGFYLHKDFGAAEVGKFAMGVIFMKIVIYRARSAAIVSASKTLHQTFFLSGSKD